MSWCGAIKRSTPLARLIVTQPAHSAALKSMLHIYKLSEIHIRSDPKFGAALGDCVAGGD